MEDFYQMLCTEFKLERETITPAKTLEELGIDSLSLYELMLEVENKFNITIDNKAINALRTQKITIEKIEDLIKRSANNAPNVA